MLKKKSLLFPFSFVLLFFCLLGCKEQEGGLEYLNLSDTVDYVGIETCKTCHYDKYQTFVHTGMGQSFGLANHEKSASNIHKDSVLYDAHSNYYYHPLWEDSSLMLKEFRLQGLDTVHQRSEKVDYIIGSGQHTNSHLYSVNGYVHQVPFTYYTQQGRFDLPPGFEDGFNTRFNRKIGLECMSCHNSLPNFVLGSENKYEKIHLGISCERCHGPGEIHADEKVQGKFVDTSLYTDYTIVNPENIDAELQFDICSRCHLQGNAVLEEGKSFFDFKPGMKLEEVMNVYLPKYEGDDEFIMASHVDRLKMSACFVESEGMLTCISCHNPHLSVKYTANEIFNNTCITCHQEDIKHSVANTNNCVECHMPKSGSSDIPHVSVTDHKIGIPKAKELKEKNVEKKFVGLHCVNNDNPSTLSILRAYLQQFEKFGQEDYYLDSAFVYLNKLKQADCMDEWVQYYFFKRDYEGVINWFEQNNFTAYKLIFNTASYDNKHAWTWYRIGESYYKLGQWNKANACFEQAANLAPFHLEILNKLAMSLMRVQDLQASRKVFEFILQENPNFEKSYANYGYLLSLLGESELAANQYRKAIALNPDLLYAWLNYAAYYLQEDKLNEAKKCLKEVLRINPEHTQAIQILNQIDEKSTP